VDFVVAYLCGSIHEAFGTTAVLPEHGHGLALFVLIAHDIDIAFGH
jgi:hypothetical protein